MRAGRVNQVVRVTCLGDTTSIEGSLGQLANPVVILDLGEEELEFKWGHTWQLGTAAYWVGQARVMDVPNVRMGESLIEEVAACLLGGYGIPAEVGLAAFLAVKDSGLLEPKIAPSEKDIHSVLSQPLEVAGRSKMVRYRFAQQRASRLAMALQRLCTEDVPRDPLALRGWLMDIPGVGPKTASWIVRNVTDLDGIAVIDVHIRRAGVSAGFFLRRWRLPQDYWLHEAAFQAVCLIARIPTSTLDVSIWSQMQSLGNAGGLLLGGGPKWREVHA